VLSPRSSCTSGRDSAAGLSKITPNKSYVKGVYVTSVEPKAWATLVHHWQGATKRAGCAERIMHDLRRTAVRDFLEAGVDEGTIMLLCDWKTRSVFDRYNIIN
jgi:hypothetical protein